MPRRTSGNYRQGYLIGGRRYNHIFDPKTGWPVEHMISVTVVAKDCMSADAFATGLTVAGPSKAFVIANNARIDFLMIEYCDDGWRAWASDGFEKYLMWEF